MQGSGFNPVWDDRLELGQVHRPDLAVLRFSVWSNASELMHQATVPISAVRPGIR